MPETDVNRFANAVAASGWARCFLLITIGLLATVLSVVAQRPQRFHKQLPPGNYSSIAPLGDNRYAIVSDKSETDGFYVVSLRVDTVRGRITSLENEGYHSSGLPNRDMEGICYCPPSNTVFIAGEKDCEIFEYSLDGKRTGRRLDVPQEFKNANRNFGLESLTYDARQHLFYTTTERPLKGDTLLRIQTFGDDLTPRRQYLYKQDAPISSKHIYGVSELCALDDGRLLVLERQIRIPRLKVGASVTTRIYEVTPGQETFLTKQLIKELRTRLTLFSRRFANYEGLCQLSYLPADSLDKPLSRQRLLLLVADSQNRYKGILRDWFLLLPMTIESTVSPNNPK